MGNILGSHIYFYFSQYTAFWFGLHRCCQIWLV